MSLTISEKLAKYVIDIQYEQLPEVVVRQAKRCLLDSLGVTFGGYASDSSRIVLDYVRELGGPAECTVIGTQMKLPGVNAILANGAMLRFPDYLDTFFNPDAYASSTHACENIPLALAFAERQRRSGKDLLLAIVLGYELAGRFVDSFIVSTATRGFHHSTIGQYVTPLVAGKLLGLDQEQMMNAVGISGTHNTALQILDAEGEELCMAKNVAYPFAAQSGAMAALMAQKGFTGHRAIIEASGGFNESVMGGQCDLAKLVAGGPEFKILRTNQKPFAVCSLSTGLVGATLELTHKYDLKPEDVEQVNILASPWCTEHNGDPAKRFPHNKETADHSAPYMVAVVLTERNMGLDQYSEDRYNDPKIHDLIRKVKITADQSLDNLAAVVEIQTKQGQKYTARAVPAKGDYRNPMTDAEAETKFHSMASKVISDSQAAAVLDAINNLENSADTDALMKNLRAGS